MWKMLKNGKNSNERTSFGTGGMAQVLEGLLCKLKVRIQTPE
jgi:hypothetical protein